MAKPKKGLKTERAKTTVSEFLTHFLEYYQAEGGVAHRTWQDYRYHIETNIVPARSTVQLGELKPLHVDEWLRGLRERGLGPSRARVSIFRLVPKYSNAKTYGHLPGISCTIFD